MTKEYIQENLQQEFQFQHLIDEHNFSMDFHCHDHIEIFLSISGGEHFIIDDRIYDMNPGDLFVNNQLEVHRTTARPGEPYERYVLSFPQSFLLPYCTSRTDLLHYLYRRGDGFSNKISLSDRQMQEFCSLAQRYTAFTDDAFANDVMRKLIFVEMLVLTARFFREAAQTAPAASYEAVDLLSRLLEYISAHITEDLSLDELASQVGVSKYHLCKVFKAKTGTTINKYIVTRRIAEAKSLLLKGIPVTEVCYSCGFRDLSHFIRTFHSLVGLSPGNYAAEAATRESNYYFGPEINR